jgi:hypothetical protein
MEVLDQTHSSVGPTGPIIDMATYTRSRLTGVGVLMEEETCARPRQPSFSQQFVVNFLANRLQDKDYPTGHHQLLS